MLGKKPLDFAGRDGSGLVGTQLQYRVIDSYDIRSGGRGSWDNMILRYILTLIASASIASASSVALEARQSWTGGWWGQEFLTYGCQSPVIFVFAKATLEPGNLVSHHRASPRREYELDGCYG